MNDWQAKVFSLNRAKRSTEVVRQALRELLREEWDTHHHAADMDECEYVPPTETPSDEAEERTVGEDEVQQALFTKRNAIMIAIKVMDDTLEIMARADRVIEWATWKQQKPSELDYERLAEADKTMKGNAKAVSFISATMIKYDLERLTKEIYIR